MLISLSSHLNFLVVHRDLLFLLLLVQHFCASVLHHHWVLIFHLLNLRVPTSRRGLDSLFVGEFLQKPGQKRVRYLQGSITQVSCSWPGVNWPSTRSRSKTHWECPGLFSQADRSVKTQNSPSRRLQWTNECCLTKFQLCSTLVLAICFFCTGPFCSRPGLLLVWWSELSDWSHLDFGSLRWNIFVLVMWIDPVFSQFRFCGEKLFRTRVCLVRSHQDLVFHLMQS